MPAKGSASRSSDAAFPIERVVDRAVRAVGRVHGPHRVLVRMPPCAPFVRGDEDALVRALVNVIENAVLAGGAADLVEVRVGPGPGADGEAVRIDVSDNGAGMDHESLERAFEPFRGGRAGGNGLGLAIAREVLEVMGGGIALRSHPGAGTLASLHLPVVGGARVA